jgi:hypothetical protein
MTDEQLSALLRIKRYEQPPARYFDRLLEDVHRRQRADLLQLPLWKIAVERMQTFFGEHSMGHLSYAGALASVLVVGVTTIGLMTPGGAVERTESAVQLAATPTAPAAEKLLTLQASKPRLDSQSFQTALQGSEAAASQRRYIIDARPASYEPSSSF